jgi:hypothetical protein
MTQPNDNAEIMDCLREAITDVVDRFGLPAVFRAMITVTGNFIMAAAEGGGKDEFGVTKAFIEGVAARVKQIHAMKHPKGGK